MHCPRTSGKGAAAILPAPGDLVFEPSAPGSCSRSPEQTCLGPVEAATLATGRTRGTRLHHIIKT